MSTTEAPGFQACPACAAAPAAKTFARGGPGANRLHISLPGIHCAACISGVERILLATPGVAEARVNLTQRRARVRADDTVTAESLAAILNTAGFEAYELNGDAITTTGTDQTTRDLAMRLGVAGFAMMNVMLLSVAVWSGASDATRDLFHWISAAIAIPTIAFSAQPFFKNAAHALWGRRLNMDVPISLAILLAAGMSVFETAQSGTHAYFDAALSLTFFLLAGRYLDQRTRRAARSAAAELTALEVPRALSVDGRPIDIADLAVGDTILIKPGARIPVDGTIAKGASEIDRSLLTGETLPEPVSPGATLCAGEINLTGPLTLTVTATGADTSLARLAELVAASENAKSRFTSIADRAAQIYAPVVHLLALATFIGWWSLSGDLRMSLNIAVATLIITCPCALGLAVPAVSTAASGRLFRAGVLIKDATALERLAAIDTIVFDKTGTLTQGRPVLEHHTATREEQSIARALAETSSHPLAEALTQAITQPSATLTDIKEFPGSGLSGRWQGRDVRLGRAEFVGATPGDQTETWLRIEGRAPSAFRFQDQMRPGAERAIADLKDAGYDIHLLSGDTPRAVSDLADRLGITTWHAAIGPTEKSARITDMRNSGKNVLMVGDGLNDTAALAAANISIAPASALDASRTVSDIVLMGASLAPLPNAIETAKSAQRRILENFGVAITYNMIAIPVAVLGFATPLAAALAMSTSSVLVTLNALRLR